MFSIKNSSRKHIKYKSVVAGTRLYWPTSTSGTLLSGIKLDEVSSCCWFYRPTHWLDNTEMCQRLLSVDIITYGTGSWARLMVIYAYQPHWVISDCIHTLHIRRLLDRSLVTVWHGLTWRWRVTGIPSWYSTKPPRPTQPGHPSVGRRNEY